MFEGSRKKTRKARKGIKRRPKTYITKMAKFHGTKAIIVLKC